VIYDPYRVGTILSYVPVALPPATDFDAFGVERDPQKANSSEFKG